MSTDALTLPVLEKWEDYQLSSTYCSVCVCCACGTVETLSWVCGSCTECIAQTTHFMGLNKELKSMSWLETTDSEKVGYSSVCHLLLLEYQQPLSSSSAPVPYFNIFSPVFEFVWGKICISKYLHRLNRNMEMWNLLPISPLGIGIQITCSCVEAGVWSSSFQVQFRHWIGC